MKKVSPQFVSVLSTGIGLFFLSTIQVSAQPLVMSTPTGSMTDGDIIIIPPDDGPSPSPSPSPPPGPPPDDEGPPPDDEGPPPDDEGPPPDDGNGNGENGNGENEGSLFG